MPSISFDELTDDDLEQSALVGILLADGLERLSPPLSVGDRVVSNPAALYRLGSTKISAVDLNGLEVTSVRYIQDLETDQLAREVRVVGWVIGFAEYRGFYFRAGDFEKQNHSR